MSITVLSEDNFGRERGGGEMANFKRINLLLIASVSKYSIDSLILSFIEGCSGINDLCRNLTVPCISWQDRFAESVFSNLFPERGTSVFFGLRHAIYLPREMRNENKQWLPSERVAF